MALKLLLLNIEGTKHYPEVTNLIKKERPDVLCLQEVPRVFLNTIEKIGYSTTYLPRCVKRQDNGNVFEDGIVIASNKAHSATTHNYFTTDLPNDQYSKSLKRRHNNHGVIVAEITHQNKKYIIANTHFTWAADGKKASETQIADMKKLLSYLQTLPPHIFCGDLNIPRAYNKLYKELIKEYSDAIPKDIKTSLDKTHHRMSNEEGKQVLLETFMVDYILTKPEYAVSNVRQICGVSDHCAVIADIYVSK